MTTLASGAMAKVGAVLAPVLGIALWVAPLPLPEPSHRLAAIFVAVVVLWLTEAIPVAVTAMLIAPAMIASGICDARAAFAPYADPLLFLFVGGFMIANAMSRHGLDRRLALGLVRLPFVRGRAGRVRLVFMIAALLISAWVSNTATTAMLLPILLGLHGETARDDPSVTGSALAIAYASNIGGLATPLGSPPNLIAMRFLADSEHPISFLDWVVAAAPVVVLGLAATYLVLAWLHPARGMVSDAAAAPPGKWSTGELATAFAFGVAVLGWVLPDVLSGFGFAWAQGLPERIDPGGVAIVAAAILYAVPDGKGERVLPWREGVRIDWGIILLFGGGLSLGKQMFETGLAEVLARSFVGVTGVESGWWLVAILVAFTILFTEVCSNTATANMLVPIAIAMANEVGVSPIPAVLGVGLAATCGFMMPIGTGPNALVYGTGRASMRQMIRAGFWLDLACVGIVVAGLYVVCTLAGWS